MKEMKGTIHLTVRVVNKILGGFSFPSNRAVVIATNRYWDVPDEEEVNRFLIHEVGHKLGLTTDGTGILPDKISKYYKDKGHIGNHCHSGISSGQASYNDKEDVEQSRCVMYGAITALGNFCPECSTSLIIVHIK